jgi:hypothetical protein
MKAFVVCLYDWDYKCDKDVMKEILAVYGTLKKAVQFSLSFPLDNEDRQIEILELDGSLECGRYTKNGKKMDSS